MFIRTGLENFWSLFKRSLKGTYVSVEPYHLQAYADEQAFRFNNREDTDLGRFVHVAGQIAGRRITYKELTGKALDAAQGCGHGNCGGNKAHAMPAGRKPLPSSSS